MINWIIFDLGGVIVPESNDRIEKGISTKLKIDRGEFLQIKKKHENDLTTGKITLLEFYSIFFNIMGENIEANNLVTEHVNLYEQYSSKWDKSILDLIINLKKKYKIACLTNTEFEIAQYNKGKGLFEYFDKSFISSDIGLKKPDQNIFEFVLKDLNCNPKNLLFIDDKIENVIAAKNLGINCIHYKPSNQLSSAIKFYESS